LREKKMLLISLCLVMFMSIVLAACSDNKNSNKENNPIDNENPSSTGKLTDKDVTYTIALPENALQPINPNSPSIQVVYEKTGIKLKIMVIPGSDYESKMNTLLAGGQLPDFFAAWGQPMDLYESGALLPMRDLIEGNAPIIQNDYDTIAGLDRTMINDDIYFLPMIRRDVNFEKGTLPIIRMDLLEEQKLDIPTTWDELHVVLGKLRDAYPNSIPYGARGDGRLLIDPLSPLRSMGAHYDVYPDKDNVWHLGRIEPEYKKAVEFYNQLYTEKILDNEYLLVSTQDWLEGLSSGKYLYFYDNPVFIDQVTKPLQSIQPNARFEPLPILENWYGEKKNYAQPDHYFNQWAVNKKVKDPELAVKFWDWLYSEEGQLAFNYGVEGENYEIDTNGSPQWTQATLDKYLSVDNSYYALQSALGVGNLSFAPSWLSASADVFRAMAADSISPEYIHNLYKDDPAIIKIPVQAPYTRDEGEQLKIIRQKINDYSQTELNKFLSGQRPLNQFDQFVQEVKSRGADDMLVIVNEAEKRFNASK
jgi:putative aldouronate transport system substrate-binding protein